MQDYGFDPKTTSAKAAKVEQEFYKNLGLKKRFNVNDQILAEKTYADEYNLDPLNLTVQQKALAANDYKEKYGSFVEGSNVYSQFLYENYGIGEDLREVTEAIANDTVETKSWFKDAIKWASDFVGSSVIFETKQEFDRLSEDGFSVVDGLSLLSTFTTQSALKLLPDSIKDGITRGASSIVNAAGNTMTYLADKRQTKVNTLMTGIEEDVNKQEDFNRYIELKDKRNKGTLTEQEQKELTNIVDNYKSSELQLYKDTKDGVGDLYSKLNVLGKSLESLGDTIQSLEMLNNEYTKGIKSGEIEMSWKDYRFWTNQMPEVVGQMGALMGLTMLTPGVPDEYALAGYVIESIPINVMFSASEAQDVRRSSIEAGLSEEEADKKATETFRWNFGLQAVTGSAPGAFTKLASRTNVFSKVISSNWAKKAIAIGTDSFLEGFEEVAQQSIQNYQLSGEAQVLAKGNLEIFMLGAAGGLMGGGLQLANERSFNKTFDAVIEQAPIVQVMYEENIKEGMDEVEAKDKAMSDFSDAASSAMEKLTKVAVQEEVAEQLIKPIADAEQQKTKIQNAQKAEMNVEERNSQIGGANFKYDESNPNARVYDGIDMQSQYTDDYAINEYLMRKTVSRYPNIKYDPKTNSYRTEGKMTKFATEVNDKSNRYSGLNKLLQKLGTDVTTDNVKQYMKKNELKNNDIHNIYDAKAITTQQYVKALKSMKLKARDSQLAKNMDNGSKIEKMINKLDKLSAKEYRSFVDSLIKEHGTLEAGLKQLVEDGVINANDAAKFKNHENTIKQEEKDDTKKQLEAATKVVESQKEAATKNKETVKTLKDENKKLKTTLKTEQLPQEVNTVKEIQDDPKIGKSIEQKKIVEMKQKKNDKEIDQIFIKQTHKIEAPKIEPDGVIKTPTNEIKVGDVIRKQQSANGKIIDVDFKVISVEKNDNGAYLTLYSEKYDVTRKNMLYFEKDGTSKLTFDVVAKYEQVKNAPIEKTQKSDSNIFNDKSVGVHIGNEILKAGRKSEPAHNVGGRSTGHFGTGTYFTSRTEHDLSVKNKKRHVYDFSKHNLFKPKTKESAFQLHETLKKINDVSFIDDAVIDYYKENQEYLDNDFDVNDFVNTVYNALYDEKTERELDIKDEIEIIDNFILNGEKMIELEIVDETSLLFDNEINMINKDKTVLDKELEKIATYKDIAEMIKKEMVENKDTGDKYSIKSSAKSLDNDFRYIEWFKQKASKNKIVDFDKGLEFAKQARTNVRDMSDSASTLYMKSLGYEGIDVRHLPMLDNLTYGSVIYDIKKENMLDGKLEEEVKKTEKSEPKKTNRTPERTPVKKTEPLIQALRNLGISPKTTLKTNSINVNSSVEGDYGRGWYFDGLATKYKNEQISKNSYINTKELNLFTPKNSSEGKNMYRLLVAHKDIVKNLGANSVYNMFSEDYEGRPRIFDDFKTFISLNDKLLTLDGLMKENGDIDEDAMIYETLDKKEKQLIKAIKKEYDPDMFYLNDEEVGFSEFVDTVSEVLDFASELGFNTNKILDSIKEQQTLLEALDYDGVNFKMMQIGKSAERRAANESKYHSFVEVSVFDYVVKGSKVQEQVNKIKQKEANKQESTKIICG